jgi:hypothetical protein
VDGLTQNTIPPQIRAIAAFAGFSENSLKKAENRPLLVF